MNLVRKFAVALFLSVTLFGPVNADVIVDTGPGGPTESVSLDGQWLAAEFSIDHAYIITDIRGWIKSTGGGGQGLTAVIREDNGDVPGDILFSQTFFAGPIGGGSDWYGPDGLNWLLESGEYWVAFEVQSSPAKFQGGMDWFGIPNPLANHAYYNSGTYSASDSFSIGVQIEGFVVAVPEPSTLAVFVTGLAGMGLAKRRRRLA